MMRGTCIIAFLLPLLVLADPPAEKRVAGDVVTVSREAILPNWAPTAKAITNNVAWKCYPTAAEALAQLDYFYQILEIAKTRVKKDDPIAAGQPARKKELESAQKTVRNMPKTNSGCPDRPLK